MSTGDPENYQDSQCCSGSTSDNAVKFVDASTTSMGCPYCEPRCPCCGRPYRRYYNLPYYPSYPYYPYTIPTSPYVWWTTTNTYNTGNDTSRNNTWNQERRFW